MKLVPGECPSCGGNVEVNAETKAAICKYCGQPFVVQDAINNYNVTNVTNIDKLHADVVNVTQDERNQLANAGDTFIRQEKYAKAEEKLEMLMDKYPMDYRGYWGMIRIMSKDLSDYGIGRREMLSIQSLYEDMLKEASDEEKRLVCSQYEQYITTLETRLSGLKTDTEKKREQVSSEYEKNKRDLEYRIGILQKKQRRMMKPNLATFIVVCVIVGIFLFVLAESGILQYDFQTLATANEEVIADLSLKIMVTACVIGVLFFVWYAVFDGRMNAINEEIKRLEEEIRQGKIKYNEKMNTFAEILNKVGDI